MSEEIKNEAVSEEISSSFIDDFIIEDLAEGGRCEGMKVHTRFPPEPNGYLHIGHAKAIYVDFGTAERFNGICNLRMDDTNPTKEDVEYVDAIKEDIHWLGYDWEDRFYYASDYFEDMYNGAVELIKKGLAYVCELTPDQMREMRGDLTTPAQSPYRDRPMEESLDLFARMRAGEFEDGRMTLRAKIDLASGNFNMRDPVIYRINHMPHHRTGTKWCIYPMYDFAHPIEDAMEHIMEEAAKARIRCPLLDSNDQCVLYDYRPITCRLYGIPTAIGGKGHVCGQSNFAAGASYPTVHLDKIQERLDRLSVEIRDRVQSRFKELHEVFVPVSMALLTNYDDAYLGIGPAPKES